MKPDLRKYLCRQRAPLGLELDNSTRCIYNNCTVAVATLAP